MKTHGGVALLGLLGIAREDNEAFLVRLQTLNIESLALRTEVSPSVVDDNTNTTSGLATNTSLLQLSEGETTALTDLAVVAYGLSTDGGTEEGEGTNAKSCGLLLASLTAAKLAAWLVKPGADTQLPVLVEVIVVEDCTRLRKVFSLRCSNQLHNSNLTHRCCAQNPWRLLQK